MKKVYEDREGYIRSCENRIKRMCPMTFNSGKYNPCSNGCMWFNVIEIASVRIVTCGGIEMAELVEDKK